MLGAFGANITVVLALPGMKMATEWWTTLPLARQIFYGGLTGLVGLMVVNNGFARVLGVSLIGLVAWLKGVSSVSDGPTTGREVYNTGAGTTLRRRFSRSDKNTIPVDEVYQKGADSPASPEVDREVSMGVAGQTNKGKSSFVKDDVRRWGSDESIFAHGLREPGERNEVRDFLAEQGFDVLNMSSQGSEVRWDPFLDTPQDLAAMQNLAQGLYTAEQVKETGWSKSERMLLTAILVYCSVEYGDFGYFPDVLETAPEKIIETVEQVPEASLVVQSLKRADKSDLDVFYGNVTAVMAPLASSDICDRSLPAVGLGEFCENPAGRAVVLDNITSDTFAEGFWRVLTMSAIDIAYETPGRQQFWLDEADKLPRIDNLGKLASAGRKSGTRGVIMVQDVHQLKKTYGDETAKTIWSNCPNRVMFSAGDAETAEFFLEGLGERELHQRDVTAGTDEYGEIDQQTSYTTSVGTPLLTADLMNQDPGMALIQSPEGWWRAKISEPSF
jgi:hypothetical protein